MQNHSHAQEYMANVKKERIEYLTIICLNSTALNLNKHGLRYKKMEYTSCLF